MAVSVMLAAVFSLSLSWTLLAVFVWRVEEKLELGRSGVEEMDFLRS